MDERPRITTTNPGDRDRIWRERVRRQEVRSGFLAPIYVMWTPGVPQYAAQAAAAGVVDTLRASGQAREVVTFGASTFSQGDYSSAQWYVDEAYRRQELRRDVGHGLQLDAGQFAGLFNDEPWQENPHWEVLIVNKDLNCEVDGRFINFVFGVTRPDFPYSVQSVRRILSGVDNLYLQAELIRRVLRHEVEHMFGLPDRTENTTENLGTHCTNVCTMRQGVSVGQWGRQWAEETNMGLQFCGDCLTDLEKSRDYLRPLSELPQGLRRGV